MSSEDLHISIPQIQATELAALLQEAPHSVRVIDVRDADFEGGNIIGSTNIPYFDEEKAVELVNSIIQYNRDRIMQARTKDKSIIAKQLLSQLRTQGGNVGIGKNIVSGEDEMVKLVVFHCYYCRMRGPTAAKLFQDILIRETANLPENQNPIQRDLIVPKVKFLKGGWSQWKKLYKNDGKLTENAKQLQKFIKAVRRE
ncbi:predicted protein [Naegleria gruberi]|uniref:Predicted protein n=1 Tax=Naegleria gruberi TaxID=5762 RepID=D2V887_NAEGR|nr:uncharacterized protein NAEGRDRAFT_65067 [Naegleria gruberi]EFC47135.1 predicted protein [Naegleria gruberi]|eukprot:XP_002679879.1 predicted protein [Naegleria gruberi strain NEG-M]